METAIMATKDQEYLARALLNLATEIASAPRTVIGLQAIAVAGPGSSGNVTGLKVVATGGPGRGNVVGVQATAVAGPDPANDLVQELRDAAVATRQGKGNKSWFNGLLKRVGALKDRAIDSAAVALVQEGMKAVFGA
jgi:hypothetical protein